MGGALIDHHFNVLLWSANKGSGPMHDYRSWRNSALAVIAVLLTPAPAFAYMGPGAGIGTILAALGVLGAIMLWLFSLIYYPIKRLMRKRRNRGPIEGQGGPAE
jgi:hypothetical protein